jgi:hypothetical protein
MMIKQPNHSILKFVKSALLLGLLGMCQSVVAQNLQFGKTKFIDSKADTVPAGKVWKIESFVYSQSIATCPTTATSVNISDSIILNGRNMMVRAQRFSGFYQAWSNHTWGPEFFLWEQKTPMWLPTGTTIAAGRGVMYISVLEFKESP